MFSFIELISKLYVIIFKKLIKIMFYKTGKKYILSQYFYIPSDY